MQEKKNDLVRTKEKIWCGRRKRFDARRGKDLTWNLSLAAKIVPALNARTPVPDRNHNTTAPTTCTVVLSALLSLTNLSTSTVLSFSFLVIRGQCFKF